jgi:hypothetical protein
LRMSVKRWSRSGARNTSGIAESYVAVLFIG